MDIFEQWWIALDIAGHFRTRCISNGLKWTLIDVQTTVDSVSDKSLMNTCGR